MNNSKYKEEGTYTLEEIEKAPMLFIPVEQQTPQYERVVLLRLKEKCYFAGFIECKYIMAWFDVSGGSYTSLHPFFLDGEGNRWELDEVDSWMYIEHLDKILSQKEIKITSTSNNFTNKSEDLLK